MRMCRNLDCYVPETACSLGHRDHMMCTEIGQSSADSTSTLQLNSIDAMLLPWSGSALGLSDLAFISGRARPVITAIIGPQYAGKTTLLGAWYLLLGHGATIDERDFAGSHSLAGWEAVSSSMRWTAGSRPTFPAHTTSRDGRAPGLLHLSFWHGKHDKATDYLFTDAPGEWFGNWAIDRDASAGARWIADTADSFILVADRQALSGERMGAARNELRQLAHRLASERDGRPVALVWTKSDFSVSPEVENAVRKTIFETMPDIKEFSVSVKLGEPGTDDAERGLIALLEWTLAVRRPCPKLPPPASHGMDPMFLFGATAR